MIFDASEDELIRKNVELHPYNLQEAFRKASIEITACTPTQVQGRYYSYIRYKSPIFHVMSDKYFGSNTKNFKVQTKSVKMTKKESQDIQYIIPFKNI
jgi:hypothetical protein